MSEISPSDPSDWSPLEGLLRRIEQRELPSYVYTYPPKGAYRSLREGHHIEESWRDVRGPLALYIHVPFCDIKCSFCRLFQSTRHTDDLRSQYVEALRDELNMVTACMKNSDVEIHSIYFGGGTPTLLSPGQLLGFLDYLRSQFHVHPKAEVSIESTPNAIDVSRCSELRAIGFNRISFGIQSFDNKELISVGRTYGADLGAEMVMSAAAAGFPNVNIDLIYGLPGQTIDIWTANIRKAIEVGSRTITLYPLVVRNRTAFGKQRADDPSQFSDEDLHFRMYHFAKELLIDSGYKQHTFVTYAKDGGGNRHEANEFIGLPTLGLGAGSRSYNPSFHYTSDDYFERKGPAAMTQEYLQTVRRGEIPVRSGIEITRSDALRRYVILGLLYQGVSVADYSRRFCTSIYSDFKLELEILETAGCLRDVNGAIRLTQRGKNFSSLIADFLTTQGIRTKALEYR